MGDWFSIEVIDGAFAATRWADAEGDALIWRAQEYGLADWTWEHHSWGVVLELELPDEATWDAFLADAAVQAALDLVPDRATGLLVYRGRGGSAGARDPRRPRPLSGAGAAALPLPLDDVWWPPMETPTRVLLLR